MQSNHVFLPNSSPLAPQTDNASTSVPKGPPVIPTLPVNSLEAPSTIEPPLGVRGLSLVFSPRVPTTRLSFTPQSTPSPSQRETAGVGQSLPGSSSFIPGRIPSRLDGHSSHTIRMNYQETRNLVSNVQLKAHPSGFQPTTHSSSSQIYLPGLPSGCWTPKTIHQISPKQQGAPGPLEFYHSIGTSHPSTRKHTSGGVTPDSIRFTQHTHTSPTARTYRQTVHFSDSHQPLLSPLLGQSPYNYTDNQTPTYTVPQSPLLIHNGKVYSKAAVPSSSYQYASQPRVLFHSTGDPTHYMSPMSTGDTNSSTIVQTPRALQCQQHRVAEAPGNAAPRYPTQHATTCYPPLQAITSTTGRSRPSPLFSFRIGGMSGAMTAREPTSKQHCGSRAPVRQLHTPGSQMNSSQWIDDEGPGRRGGRSVLGKFLESLKSTLGMHGPTGSPIEKRETAPLAQESRKPKLKAPFQASSSVVSLRNNALDEPNGDAPGIQLRNQPSENSFKSMGTHCSDENTNQTDKLRRSPSHENDNAVSSAASQVSQPSALAQQPAGSPVRVKLPKLNLSAVLGAPRDFALAGPTTVSFAAEQDCLNKRLNASSLSGQYHTPLNSTTVAGIEHSESASSTPTTPGSSPGFPTIETPAASAATDYNAKTPGAIFPRASRNYDSDKHIKQTLPQKYNNRIPRDSSNQTAISVAPKPVRFSWIVARALIKLQMQPAESFSVNGVPWPLWELHKIPTLGASPTSCRVQEMYKATIPPATPSSKHLRVFVKSIPVAVWRKQWESQNKWGGEYVTDGENFVMEAAALAFLQQYGPDIAPRLLGVLELSTPASRGSKLQKRRVSQTQRSDGREEPSSDVTHVVIVSELYGEDLLDFLENREKENIPLTESEKKSLQFDCICLLNRLHHLGLAHLDFTPENVLYGSHGLRLCDFAKATPMWSNNFRHVKDDVSFSIPPFPFESCEPTVGKGAYMPPECWKVYWRLEDTRIQYPLEELWSLAKPTGRTAYYFRVDRADVYMAGVLLFWLWSEGGIWKCSDVKQDEKYNHLVKSGLDFDLFRECRSWPSELKDVLGGALRPDPRYRTTLEEFIGHAWFSGLTPSKARERLTKMVPLQQSTPPHTDVNENALGPSELLSNTVEAAH